MPLLRLLILLALAAPVALAQQVIERKPTPESRRDNRARAETYAARVRELGFTPRASYVALTRDEAGRVSVGVFLRAEYGVEDRLTALGGRVGVRTGEWLTAQVPADRLDEIRAIPGVRGMELARQLEFATTSMEEVRASTVRRRVEGDEFAGATGRGTIVGVVDSGIDYKHGDFIDDATGESRILYLWDQAPSAGTQGRPPGVVGGVRFDYGIECTRSQLGRSGTCPSKDTDGHGTHVAGIAAGDGSGANRGQPRYDYVGVAPEADLIIVRSPLSTSSVADGVAYIFARAEQLGKPAVVNLSLGTDLSPHDGSSALSVVMDELAGPGRIIVAAAGNDGSNFLLEGSLHGEVTVARGDSAIMEFAMPNYTAGSGVDDDLVLLQAFYAAADTFAVTLVRPDGSRISVGFSATTEVAGPNGGVILYNGTALGDSIVRGLEFSQFFATTTSNMFEAFIGEWDEGYTRPAPGVWRIIFRKTGGSGPGLVDAYLPLVTIAGEPYFTVGATNRRLVGSPADGKRVIAVGGYNHLARWRAYDGNEYSFNSTVLPVSEILYFSSPGPTRDGRLKPEIVAPGVVLSSMSQHAFFGGDPRFVSPDSAHVLEAGTSMSTPHVAGAVALLLSVYQHLTPEQALDALTRGARRDEFTSRTWTGDANASPNASWGYGKLDVAAALANVRALMLAEGQRFNISQNPVRSAPVVIRFDDSPRRVDVFDFAGRRVRTFLATDLDDARTLRWNLRGASGEEVVNGVYLLVVDMPSGTMRRKVFIVR